MPIGYSPDALVFDPGTNSWSLRPDYDPLLHRVDIAITDDDDFLDGDQGTDETGFDSNQTAVVTDMAGNPITSGQIYDEEFYAVWDGVNPHIYIERVEIGGVHVGYFVSAPLAPDTAYSQSTVGDVDAGTAATYSSFNDVPCYAPGTMIDTPDGPRAVETLCPGDLVLTLDNAAQTIQWVHHGEQPLEDIEIDARPVLIRVGALGHGRPARDLTVSPQHRILVGGHRQLQDTFETEAFVPAKALTSLPRIRHMAGKRQITWIHFACERHEVVFANGCLSESLLLGPMAIRGLTRKERMALTEIYGSGSTPDAALNGPPARECLTVGKVRRLLGQGRVRKDYSLESDIRNWELDLAMELQVVDRKCDSDAIGHTRHRALRAV